MLAAIVLSGGMLLAPPALAADCPTAGCPAPGATNGPDSDGATTTPTPSPDQTPSPDPTTTPDPTSTPIPTPTPSPGTPQPTPTPAAPSPAPPPTTAAPAPTDDVALAVPHFGAGRTLDLAQTQRAAELASRLATAQQDLVAATDTSRGRERERQQADAATIALQAQATVAKQRAAASRAFATALIRAAGSQSLTDDPLAAVLAGHGDLLTKLGAADRLRALSENRIEALRKAAADAKAAEAAERRANSAARAATTIDVTGGHQAVADAQARVDTAATALAGLPTVIAAGAGWQALTVDPAAIPAGWTLPVRGPLTDLFGPRPSRPAGTALFHPGDDIGAACGATIAAAAAGTVIEAGPNGSYGNFVLIDHGGAVQSAYGHIRDGGIAVTVGQTVAAGQPIAQVGSTGASTGCHLHLEVRVNGIQIDPQPFLAARGVLVGAP